MIIDRYAALDLFALIPQLGSTFEPSLRELDRLLEDDVLFQRVKADLAKRYPHSLTAGRHSTPVEVILRLLVVKRLYRWSYAETERFVSDSLVLRQFTRVYLEAVPDDTTLIRWANLIGPRTVEQLNQRVVELAQSLHVTRGRKLRVDSTVVETTIHHPSDGALIGDGVRVLSRLLRRAKSLVGDATTVGRTVFRSRTRSVRRLAQQMHRVARRKGEDAVAGLKTAYQRLIHVARQSLRQAKTVVDVLKEQTDGAAQRLVAHFETFGPRIEQAITQAVRRVIDGEAVPSPEKIVSLFEPHTQIIVRHKAGKAVEFGRKIWLEEVEGGIVSGYRILTEAGQDYAYLKDSLTAHRKRFGHPPRLVAGDRGVASPANEEIAKEAGVKRVAIPDKGRASPERIAWERQRWFRDGYRFRAGIEGRISVLQRCYEMDRCRDHGDDGMGRWVGWGIVTANLAKIAQTVVCRPARAA